MVSMQKVVGVVVWFLTVPGFVDCRVVCRQTQHWSIVGKDIYRG